MGDIRDPERDQVAPIPNDGPSCHDLVIDDLIERKAHGLTKYGSLLQPNNGRSMLLDIYEELLDATAYIRGKLEEERTREWKPGRWWRVTAPDGSIWYETSSEEEARKAVRSGDILQRLYRQEPVQKWEQVEL